MQGAFQVAWARTGAHAFPVDAEMRGIWRPAGAFVAALRDQLPDSLANLRTER
jgi:hypothetical protein